MKAVKDPGGLVRGDQSFKGSNIKKNYLPFKKKHLFFIMKTIFRKKEIEIIVWQLHQNNIQQIVTPPRLSYRDYPSSISS